MINLKSEERILASKKGKDVRRCVQGTGEGDVIAISAIFRVGSREVQSASGTERGRKEVFYRSVAMF